MCIKRTLLLILVCFIIPLSVWAQRESSLKGAIFKRGSIQRVGLVEITNKRSKVVVKTNELGLFDINVIVGDSLYFFKEGFTDMTLAVTSTKDMVVQMQPVLALDQVTIRGQSKKQEMDEIKKDFKNKGSFYAGKPPLLSYIFSPITAVYELFGRTPRNARRFGRYYNNEVQQSAMDTYYNKESVKRITGLEGEPLAQFLDQYRPLYQKVALWGEYDWTIYIKKCYKDYQDTAVAKKQ